MYIGDHYSLKEFIFWTRRDIYLLLLLAVIPTVLFEIFDLTWIATPWVPVALIGTASAFIAGFKNTQSYNRLWEARQIWGAIVNGSRSWGIHVRDLTSIDKAIQMQMIKRHLAWLTALRYQLRKSQPWETQLQVSNKEYHAHFSVPEWNNKLEDELKQYLSDEEYHYILTKKNRATQLISLQSRQLRSLKEAGNLGSYEFVELERRLADFYDQQGKCERIKNFPYPRQFASINLFFIWLFVIMLPYGMLNEFQKLGEHMSWLTIPFSVIVSWVFTSMEKVGSATENPFEGSANDVPMATMSRAIEIDLLDMMDEKLPEPLTPVHNILM